MEVGNPKQTTYFYEFGPFLVDAMKCVLLRNGEVVPLNLKAFEILLVLIQRRGQLVEKDELLKQVWPDTTVEENNLPRHISALRKALDEQPNERQYILTVPGRGYRFVANVIEVGQGREDLSKPVLDGVESHIASEEAVANDHQVIGLVATAKESFGGAIRRHRRDLVGILVAFVAGIVATSFVTSLIWRRSEVNHPPSQRRLWQLTFDPGLEGEPTWSPDGRLIAYGSDRGGNFDIWVQPVSEGHPVRVTKSPAHDWQPDWAPDGSHLVFRSERDGGGLFVVPALGGNERKVSSFGYRPRWAPDGAQILFSSSQQSVTEPPKMYVVGLDGKPPREVLSEFISEFIWPCVAWHPDGQRLSLWGNHLRQGWGFWTVPLTGGSAIKSELAAKVGEQLKEADVRFTNFLWSSSGQTLYFEGVSQNVRNLWKVEVDPRTLQWVAGPERLTTGAGLDTDLALSRDSKRLAFTVRSERMRLWSLPLDAATGRVEGKGQPVTATGMDAYFPDLSPDGKRLVFTSRRPDKWELWEKSLKDGRETLLMADNLSRYHPVWSRDGLRLAYRRSRLSKPDGPQTEKTIALLPIGGSEEQLLTTPGETPELVWDWSADGKWIMAGSERQTPGRFLICLFPIASAPHAETQMRVVASHPEENLWQARFSPDDRWISFVSAKATEAGLSTIYVISASGGEWRRITAGKYFDDKPRWSRDGQKLYFISNRTGFFNVWSIRFDQASGQPLGDPFRVTDFETPGQMILYDMGSMGMTLADDRLILPIIEVSGGIWILDLD